MNSCLLSNLWGYPAVLAQLESLQTHALQLEVGNDKDYSALHVAFKLDLQGPCRRMSTCIAR